MNGCDEMLNDLMVELPDEDCTHDGFYYLDGLDTKELMVTMARAILREHDAHEEQQACDRRLRCTSMT